MTWGKRTHGINLVWTKDPNQKKIHFRNIHSTEKEIISGEVVALGIGGGDAFLYYAERPVGINLKWSKSPKFEWIIYNSSGVAGEKINTDTWVAIINTRLSPEPDFLVHHVRPAGINIGWTSSPGWLDALPGSTKLATKLAITKFLDKINPL